MNEHKQAIRLRRVSQPKPSQLSYILKRDLLSCGTRIKNDGDFKIYPGNNCICS